MGIFVCDECSTMENSALGFYWGRGITEFQDESKNNKALCSACTPPTFKDGSPTNLGKWHGEFERKIWDGKRKVMNR